MHRSRIGVVLLDHPPESYDTAAAFWSEASGSQRTLQPVTAEHPYASLDPLPGGVDLAMQRTGVGTAPRVHLDIETDDVPAEIARLLALGARVLTEHIEHTVLTDPGGLQFCVVPVQNGPAFEAHAVSWP